jgi:DNA helicase IV
MEAQKHPAYAEEQEHLDNTIANLEADKAKKLKPPNVEMYAPPDTIRIFSNEAARQVKDINAALRYLYFGRIDWKSESAEKTDHFYIGISPLYPHILAWQDTLASELYYNRQTKREAGELLLVRTFRIEDQALLEIERQIHS